MPYKNPEDQKAYYERSKARNNESKRKRYHENPEKYRAVAKGWRDKNRARQMWYVSRNRAREKGFEFTITPEDIVIPEVCPIFGTPLVRYVGGHKGKEGANHPSVDRIDPRKGYIPGNVWVISYRANAIKNDATAEELLTVAAAVERKMREQS